MFVTESIFDIFFVDHPKSKAIVAEMLWHDANVVASSPWQWSSPSSSAMSRMRSQWPLRLRHSCTTVVLVVMTHSLASPSAVGLVQALASTPTTTRIQVCQNKDCRQRWSLQTPLPEVVHDLLSAGNVASTTHVPFRVESTGCLSQCGQGPNVCVINASGDSGAAVAAAAGTTGSEVYLNGLSTPIAVVSQLEDALSTSIPSKLLAAVTVLERAQNGMYENNILKRLENAHVCFFMVGSALVE
jgi:hypothetical protein